MSINNCLKEKESHKKKRVPCYVERKHERKGETEKITNRAARGGRRNIVEIKIIIKVIIRKGEKERENDEVYRRDTERRARKIERAYIALNHSINQGRIQIDEKEVQMVRTKQNKTYDSEMRENGGPSWIPSTLQKE